MTGPYRVIEADLERDREEVVALWARNFPVYTPEQHRRRFDWNYRQNPFGAGRCWLLLRRDDVVGTAGLGLRSLCMEGTPAVVGVTSDLAVDASHRCLQPALMVQKAVLSVIGPGVRAVYGTPNIHAEPLFSQLRYERLESPVRWVKILRTEPHFRRIASSPLRNTTRVLAPALDLALRLSSRSTWHLSRNTVVQQMAGYDGRFDDLWTRTATVQATASCRTSRFLNWRYTRYPLLEYSTLALLSRKKEDLLLGYCVLYPCEDDELGMADFWFDPDRPGSAADLLAGVIRWCRSAGAASVSASFQRNSVFSHVVRQFGFVPRREDATLMVRRAAGQDLAALNRWCFMPGDQDYN